MEGQRQSQCRIEHRIIDRSIQGCGMHTAGYDTHPVLTNQVTLSQVFEAMEHAKDQFEVLDWGVSTATLEEVFIKFALAHGVEGGR